MLRTVIRPLIAACLAVTLIGATAAPVSADPLADKRAQAAKVQTQIAALDTAVSKADEDYNAARYAYDKLTIRVHASERKVAKLSAKTAVLQAALGKRADQMYRSGGTLGTVTMLLSTRSIAEFNAVLDALVAISQADAATISQLLSLI